MIDLEKVNKAYKTVSKHVFIAYRAYTEDSKEIIIIADSYDIAKKKAEEYFGLSSIIVHGIKAISENDVNTYEIDYEN